MYGNKLDEQDQTPVSDSSQQRAHRRMQVPMRRCTGQSMWVKMPFCRVLFIWAAFTGEEPSSIRMHTCLLATSLPVDTRQRPSPCAFPWPFTKLVCTRFGGWAQDSCPPSLGHAKTLVLHCSLISSDQLTAKPPPSCSESPVCRAQDQKGCRPFPQPMVGSAQINPSSCHPPCLSPCSPQGSALFSGFLLNSPQNPLTYQRLPSTLLASSPLHPPLLPIPVD